jgi:hypothetical protein
MAYSVLKRAENRRRIWEHLTELHIALEFFNLEQNHRTCCLFVCLSVYMTYI